jgi:hypothetical protein
MPLQTVQRTGKQFFSNHIVKPTGNDPDFHFLGGKHAFV